MSLTRIEYPLETLKCGAEVFVFSRNELTEKKPFSDLIEPVGDLVYYETDWDRIKLTLGKQVDHFHATRLTTYVDFIDSQRLLPTKLLRAWSTAVLTDQGSVVCVLCEMHKHDSWHDMKFQELQDLAEECLEPSDRNVDKKTMQLWFTKLQAFYDARVNPCGLKPAK